MVSSLSPHSEIILLQAIAKYRPVGVHRHFLMLNVLRYFLSNNPTTSTADVTTGTATQPPASSSSSISVADIWEYLHSLYDLDMLNDNDQEDIDDEQSVTGGAPDYSSAPSGGNGVYSTVNPAKTPTTLHPTSSSSSNAVVATTAPTTLIANPSSFSSSFYPSYTATGAATTAASSCPFSIESEFVLPLDDFDTIFAEKRLRQSSPSTESTRSMQATTMDLDDQQPQTQTAASLSSASSANKKRGRPRKSVAAVVDNNNNSGGGGGESSNSTSTTTTTTKKRR